MRADLLQGESLLGDEPGNHPSLDSRVAKGMEARVVAELHQSWTVGSSLAPVTVSVEQAAQLLGVGRTVAYGLVMDGHLRSVKIGRRRLVVYASVHEYVVRLEAAGA